MMEVEINSQAGVIENLINRYIKNYCVIIDIPLKVKNICIIASGSSYNAGLFGKYFFENIAKIKTYVEYASEIANNNFEDFDPDTLYIAISQSGNTYDTLNAIEKIHAKGGQVLSITNDKTSKIDSIADFKFNLEAGKENAIAATKTFSATVVMLWILAIKIAQNKHFDISEETKNIYTIKSCIEQDMKKIENIDLAAKLISKQKDFSIASMGLNYALSKEMALKTKETSYINVNAYPLGEFIHGHFALLNKSKLFVTCITSNSTENELNILDKVLKTYKPKSIIISDTFDDFGCDILVKFEKGQSQIATIINMIVTIQLLALNVAHRLKRNVDKPKGLDKVVTNKGQ